MTTQAEETVTIPCGEYEDLLKRSFKLSCLEGGGVDNWCGYDDSLEEGGYFNDED